LCSTKWCLIGDRSSSDMDCSALSGRAVLACGAVSVDLLHLLSALLTGFVGEFRLNLIKAPVLATTFGAKHDAYGFALRR
jgi:hypothetical protein